MVTQCITCSKPQAVRAIWGSTTLPTPQWPLLASHSPQSRKFCIATTPMTHPGSSSSQELSSIITGAAESSIVRLWQTFVFPLEVRVSLTPSRPLSTKPTGTKWSSYRPRQRAPLNKQSSYKWSRDSRSPCRMQWLTTAVDWSASMSRKVVVMRMGVSSKWVRPLWNREIRWTMAQLVAVITKLKPCITDSLRLLRMRITKLSKTTTGIAIKHKCIRAQ